MNILDRGVIQATAALEMIEAQRVAHLQLAEIVTIPLLFGAKGKIKNVILEGDQLSELVVKSANGKKLRFAREQDPEDSSIVWQSIAYVEKTPFTKRSPHYYELHDILVGLAIAS